MSFTMTPKPILSVLILLSFTAFQKEAVASSWSYTNPESNPAHWAEKGFKQCGGAYQSPINIESASTVPNSGLKPIRIFKKGNNNDGYNVTNNGHTVKIDFPKDTWYISLDNSSDTRYPVLQLHFHWGSSDDKGSEHTLDGEAYAMEAHLVAFDNKLFSSYQDASVGPYAHVVLGFWSKVSTGVSRSQTQFGLMGKFEEELEDDLDVGKTVKIPAFNLAELLGQVDPASYYRYSGSLTTPGCTQNVIWTIFQKPVPILNSQLRALRKLPFGKNEEQKTMSNNFRPVQPLNPSGIPVPRTVFRSNGNHLLASWLITLGLCGVWLHMF